MQTVCNEVLKKRGNDPTLVFWRAYGLVMEGSVSEGIREYEALQNKKDIALAVFEGLMHAHNKNKVVDTDAVKEYTAKLTIEEKSTNERALIQAAYFCWHTKRHDKARDYVSKALEMAPSNVTAQILRGWIDLTCGKDALASKSIVLFEGALGERSGGKRELEAVLGKAKYYEYKEQYSQALEQLNQVIVMFAWFLPALAEKCRVLMMMGDWEQALETAQRVLSQDNFNIEALRMTVLYLLCRESRHPVAAKRLQDLIESIDRHEPRNAELYCNVSKPFARLSGRNPLILSLTLALVDRARKLVPDSADYITEYAYQQVMSGDVPGAIKSYRQATKVDETSITALYGMIKCQILEGALDDAEQQLEFLNEIQVSTGKTVDLAFLTALLAWRKYKDLDNQARNLDEAVKLHMEALQNMPLLYDYFTQFNPDWMIEIAKEFLVHVGNEPLDPTETVPNELFKATAVLESVVRVVPGLLEAQVMLARARFVAGELDGAQRSLALCLKLEPTYAEAHILVAQIFLLQDKFKQAQQALEQALSHNFEVREWPVYHLVKAKVLEATGEFEEALKVLEAAMVLPGVKTPAALKPAAAALGLSSTDTRSSSKKAAAPPPSTTVSTANSKPSEVSVHDRASIYLALVNIHTHLNHVHEASKIMTDAIHEFKGTTEEVRVTIANCELALQRGDIENALALLRMVPPDNSNYAKAKMVMANIYLQYRNDQRQYARCYQELVEKNPSMHTQILLAEAYLRIQEPEKAIASFKTALEKNPKDATLATKIGKALVTTHDYARAIKYYEDAVKNDPAKMMLRYDLAELYMKLLKYDMAEKVINEALDTKKDPDDVDAMILDVKNLLLLAQVHKGAGNMAAAMEDLQRARVLQNTILSRIRAEQPDYVREQRAVASTICYTLAEYNDEQKNVDKALSFYNEALKHDDGHEKSMLALAKLHLARGELDACQHQCVTLLRIDPMNEEASMMLADLMFRKNEYDAAIYHFQQLLERKPNHYVGLVRLILLLRRAGRLLEAQRLFKAAERNNARASLEAGLHYCKGIYNRYTNNPHEALRELNMARKDGEWGERAILNMIEIYINPDNETLLEEVTENTVSKENAESLKAVDKLLKELPQRPKGLRHQVLEIYAMMATKSKLQIETAINKFIDLLNVERDYVPALLGLSTAFMMLKQTPKARNHLKRISKMPYNSEEADEFERAWLMLADIYVQGNKMDLAQDLCKRALGANKSCAKAWEYLGLIMEKEQSYRDAAEHYENAWKYESESSPSVGFKLAFNYLKAKRYVEAVDVCHKVLTLDSNYPKIRKEILEKARGSIRP